MKLSEFIVKVLSEIDGTELEGGVVHFDVAIYPDKPDVCVLAPHNKPVPGLSRVNFDVKTTAKPEAHQ